MIQSDLPLVGGRLTIEKGHLTIPKNVTKNSQVVDDFKFQPRWKVFTVKLAVISPRIRVKIKNQTVCPRFLRCLSPYRSAPESIHPLFVSSPGSP